LRAVYDLGLLANDREPRLKPGARLEGTGYDDPRWVTLQERMGADPSFRDLAHHPALLAVVETLQGEPTAPHRGDLCRLGMPGAPALTTPPHQDHHYVGGSTDIWTAWTPLVPCPLSLGPLAVWDGSHRTGYRPHTGEGAGRHQVEVPPETLWSSGAVDMGDVVLFHCFTVHRALPNTTRDTVRLSADLRYQPASQPVSTVRVDGTRPS
jgi:ectoine hydroxylase-related dioxygenase (phytanoyl-CoA dioxygenase family)